MGLRRVAAAASVLALLVAGAACGGPDRVELTLWLLDPGSEQAEAVVDGILAEFEAGNVGVTVRVEYLPFGSAYQRFETAAAAGIRLYGLVSPVRG